MFSNTGKNELDYADNRLLFKLYQNETAVIQIEDSEEEARTKRWLKQFFSATNFYFSRLGGIRGILGYWNVEYRQRSSLMSSSIFRINSSNIQIIIIIIIMCFFIFNQKTKH